MESKQRRRAHLLLVLLGPEHEGGVGLRVGRELDVGRVSRAVLHKVEAALRVHALDQAVQALKLREQHVVVGAEEPLGRALEVPAARGFRGQGWEWFFVVVFFSQWDFSGAGLPGAGHQSCLGQ